VQGARRRIVNGHDIIVIGGSAGSFDPLRHVLADLAADLPVTVFIVVHVHPTAGRGLVDALRIPRSWKARLAEDGAPIEHGRIMIAPPDHHLIVKRGQVRVTQGPRENLWRPSIDVLFRSAAVAYGSRVAGIVLSGALDDGSAGLAAIKRCGGTAIAQDPVDARVPDMPESAIRNTKIDYILKSHEIAPRIGALASQATVPSPDIPRDLVLEAQIAETGNSSVELNQSLGELSEFTCTDCSGPLWKRNEGMLRYRCLTGHALTARALDEGLNRTLDSALWAAIRQFEQRANLYDKLAGDETARGRSLTGANYQDRASEARGHAQALRQMLMSATRQAQPEQRQARG
jgi:two-component system chemotaxis response regulator CheB